MQELILQPGDIVFFRGSGLRAKLIRWASRARGETKTIVNHVGIMVSNTEIVESQSRTIQHSFILPSTGYWIYRKKDWTQEQRTTGTPYPCNIVVSKALEYVGRKYGWEKIVAHAIDYLIFQNHYIMRRLCFIDKYPICSWVVAFSYAKVGYRFGVNPQIATPDDIWDWVTQNENWTEIKVGETK